jgi:MFS family permease
MFGLFLVGWGLSFIWGPISDRFGRTKSLAATILVYAVFTGAAAFSTNVWMLAVFRFLAGIGVGGEWAMAGTFVAEAWPEDRRKMGAGYLQTGYYFGFFVAAALNYTIGASFGWRAMFLCGLVPVVVSIATLLGVKEPERWEQKHQEAQTAPAKRRNPFAVIFNPRYLGRTITMSALLTIAIVGLWAGAVYEPTAIIFLSREAGMELPEAAKMASYGTALLSVGTILGCIAAPWLAERLGRCPTLALYYLGTMVTIALAFGWAFYLPTGPALPTFMAVLFFLGVFGGNFAIFSLLMRRPGKHGPASCSRHRASMRRSSRTTPKPGRSRKPATMSQASSRSTESRRPSSRSCSAGQRARSKASFHPAPGRAEDALQALEGRASGHFVRFAGRGE